MDNTDSLIKQLVELVKDETLHNIDPTTKAALLKTYTFGPRAQGSLAEGLDEQTLQYLTKINPELAKELQKTGAAPVKTEQLRELHRKLNKDPDDYQTFEQVLDMLKQNTKNQGITQQALVTLSSNPQLWNRLQKPDRQLLLSCILARPERTNPQHRELSSETLALTFWLIPQTKPLAADQKKRVTEFIDHYYTYLTAVFKDYETIVDLLQNTNTTPSNNWTKQRTSVKTAKETVESPVSLTAKAAGYLSTLELTLGVVLTEQTNASWEDITVALNLICDTSWTVKQIKAAFENTTFDQIHSTVASYEELNDILTNKNQIMKLAAPIINPGLKKAELKGNVYSIAVENMGAATSFCYANNVQMIEDAVENFEKTHFDTFCALVTEIEEFDLSGAGAYFYSSVPNYSTELAEALLENYRKLPDYSAFDWMTTGAVVLKLQQQPGTKLPLQLLLQAARAIKQLRLFGEDVAWIATLDNPVSKALQETFDMLITNTSSAQLSSMEAILNASEHGSRLTSEEIKQLSDKLIYETTTEKPQNKISKTAHTNGFGQ